MAKQAYTAAHHKRALRGMGSYCSIPVATHADFVSRWIVMYILISYHVRIKVHCVNYCCDCYSVFSVPRISFRNLVE